MLTPCAGCGRLVPFGLGRCRSCRSPARAIRSSSAWTRLALAVRARGVCAGCGRQLPPSQLEAGHVVPASRRPDLALDPRNVVPLCRTCNVRGPRQ